MLQEKERKKLIADFKKAMSDLYGDRLAKIILYGSYAKGDAGEESDIDFLVLLEDEKVKKFREVLNMSEVVHPLILKHDIEISYHAMSTKRFESEKSPFLFWVRQQGIEI